MQATDTNFSIVNKIIALLKEEKCTIRQTYDILTYVRNEIEKQTTLNNF